MDRSTVAALAISALNTGQRLHLDIVQVMQTMKLTSDEAVATRGAIGRMWVAEVEATGYTESGLPSERADRLSLAKTIINQYARDPRLHA